MSSYAELHCHSAFSLLDGASTPETLVGRAVELGLRALALTDHDDLGGAARFSAAARDAGLEAIIGAELTVAPPDGGPQRPSHLTLLARTSGGYANLCELVSRGRWSRESGSESGPELLDPEPGRGSSRFASRAEDEPASGRLPVARSKLRSRTPAPAPAPPLAPIETVSSGPSEAADRRAHPPPILRIGLRYVRGLGAKAKEQLRVAWEAGGPFTSVEDVVRRSGLGLPALKTLAEAGAFDTLWGPGRRSALWEVLARLADKPLVRVESEPEGEEGAMAVGRCTRAVKREDPHASPTDRTRLKEMSRVELIAADYMTTGLCTHGHPMEHLRDALRERGVLSVEELSAARTGQRVRVAGVVICRQRPGTAKGVCFITLEDETGFSNFVVYPDLFQRYRRVIVGSPVLLIDGIAQNEQDVINVQARKITPIEPAAGADAIESHDFH